MKQSRWDSPVLWGALIAQILSILVLTGILDITQSQAINTVIAAVLELLVTFGVLNSPTTKDAF